MRSKHRVQPRPPRRGLGSLLSILPCARRPARSLVSLLGVATLAAVVISMTRSGPTPAPSHGLALRESPHEQPAASRGATRGPRLPAPRARALTERLMHHTLIARRAISCHLSAPAPRWAIDMQYLVLIRTDEGPPPPPPQGPAEKTRRSHSMVEGRLWLVLTLGKGLDPRQEAGGVLWVRDDPSGPWYRGFIEKKELAGGCGSQAELICSPFVEPKDVMIQPRGYDHAQLVEPEPPGPIAGAPSTLTS